MFEIIPSVLLVEEKLAIVRGDEYEYLEDEEGLLVNPPDFVDFLSEDYKRLLVTDIDGIFNNRPNIEILKDMCENGSLWIDAGVRFYEHMMDVIICGAERAIVSTKTVFSLKELVRMAELGDILTFCIDYDNGVIAHDDVIGRMGIAALSDKSSELGFNEIIFYDIGRAMGRELAEDALREALESSDLPVYVAGVTLNDEDKLKDMGCSGAIISLKHLIEEV